MSNYRTHQNLIAKFLNELQKRFPKIRVFQRHVGLFYTKNGTPIRINTPGMSDLWAVYPTQHGLLHIEYEAKSGASKQSKEQKVWQKFIESNNGLYIIVNDDYNIAIDKTGEFLKSGGHL